MPKASTRILIVDDDAVTLNLLVNMTKFEGYLNIEMAKNGHEGLKKILVHKPHIVFLDIEMPELDGIATLRAIKEFGITTQVVMISATATSERVNSARDGGAAGFIVKPVSPKRIGDAIVSCLKLSNQEEGPIELFILP
jgi:DNA-binding NtrC family response regulator